MKHFILALAVLLIAVASPSFAVADTLLTFKDGGAPEVWQNIKRVGNKYCTVKDYIGDYCVNASDVKSVKEVPAGTQASEYSVSIAGQTADESASSRKDLDKALSKSEAEDRAFKARRDREQEARARADQKRIKNNRDHGRADWAQ